MELITHVIDGEDVESESGAKFDSVDPYTRAAYAEVALGGQTEVDRAVASARRAFDEGPWPRMGYAERGALLHRLADLVVEHGEELALADVADMGKPISDARTRDVPRTAQNLRFFADHARLAIGRDVPDGQRPPRLLAVPAGRSGRRDLAVELPADARVLEDRARARLGQHGGAQARRGHPEVRNAAGPARHRGRAAARRPQRRARLRARLRRLGADPAPRRRPDHLHRRVRDRPGDRPGGGGQPHAGQLRARRQGRQPGLRRRRPRQRRRVVDQGDLHQRRAGVPGRFEAVRPARRVRRVRGPVRRSGRGDDGWATRRTRPPSSARWPRRSTGRR